MSDNANIDLTEGFLGFLNDKDFNKNTQTFCNEKTSNSYHDSSYKWCRYCDKIICTNCILNHVLDNQITHIPIDKVFVSKELLDVELNRHITKLVYFKKNIEEYFNDLKKLNKAKTEFDNLNETLQKFKDFMVELFKILKNFENKLKNEIDYIKKASEVIASKNIKENYVKSNLSLLSNKFVNIENNYSKNIKFEPSQMKEYYNQLSEAHEEFAKLNEYFNSNNSSNNNIEEIDDTSNKIKNKLNNGINTLKICSDNIKKLFNNVIDNQKVNK